MSVLRQIGSGIWHRLEDRLRVIRLNRIAGSASAAGVTPRGLFGGLKDDYWFWLHTEGCRRSPELRQALPGLPDETTQANFTGSTGDRSLWEAFTVYTLFKRIVERHARGLSPSSRVLDFGCGWGRMIRFFLKDVEPANLWGLDINGEVIEICKQTNRWCQFRHIPCVPPTPLEDSTFDLIYAYSVFSHLSEDAQDQWLVELNRLLKPGGLLIATTRDRAFIEWCGGLRNDSKLDSYPPWVKVSAVAFPDAEKCLADYDNGGYCFSPHGYEGDVAFFGEAAIPRGYVTTHWTRYFTFLDFIDDRSQCLQNVIVVRK